MSGETDEVNRPGGFCTPELRAPFLKGVVPRGKRQVNSREGKKKAIPAVQQRVTEAIYRAGSEFEARQ